MSSLLETSLFGEDHPRDAGENADLTRLSWLSIAIGSVARQSALLVQRRHP